jgi:hypothetical protein
MGRCAEDRASYDGMVDEMLSEQALKNAHCWEASDRVPGRPQMTSFRQQMRLHQATWREANGHPIGSQPMTPQPGKPVRFVGSRMPLDVARTTGANFVTNPAHEAAKARMAKVEPQQSIDRQGLWADLLSSTALCFNLFGDLAADRSLADRAIHTWWPDTPGTVSDVHFEHSPGRLDLAYLGSLSAFTTAFVTDIGDGTRGVIGIWGRLHERSKSETPKPIRLAHYGSIADRSGVFAPEAFDAVNGTDLTLMWLQHLLVLSMLQHPGDRWAWGRLVVVHPSGNVDYAGACERYRTLLVDPSTFASITIEDLLDSNALPEATTAALRERYVVA